MKKFLLFVVILAGCNKSNTRRVIVVYPEQWNAGEFRNCSMVGNDPISGLPQLDCDLQSRETPRSRMFTQDVQFSGQDKKDGPTVWTCQKSGDSLICRN